MKPLSHILFLIVFTGEAKYISLLSTHLTVNKLRSLLLFEMTINYYCYHKVRLAVSKTLRRDIRTLLMTMSVGCDVSLASCRQQYEMQGFNLHLRI